MKNNGMICTIGGACTPLEEADNPHDMGNCWARHRCASYYNHFLEENGYPPPDSETRRGGEMMTDYFGSRF